MYRVFRYVIRCRAENRHTPYSAACRLRWSHASTVLRNLVREFHWLFVEDITPRCLPHILLYQPTMTMSLLSKISRPFVSKTTQKLSAKSCGGLNNVAVRSMAGDAESRTSAVSDVARDLSTRMHCVAIGTFQNSISSPIFVVFWKSDIVAVYPQIWCSRLYKNYIEILFSLRMNWFNEHPFPYRRFRSKNYIEWCNNFIASSFLYQWSTNYWNFWMFAAWSPWQHGCIGKAIFGSSPR